MKKTLITMTAEDLANILTEDGHTFVLQPVTSCKDKSINWFDDTKLIRRNNSEKLYDWFDSHLGEEAFIRIETKCFKLDFITILDGIALSYNSDSICYEHETGTITLSLTGANIKIERDEVSTEEILILESGDTLLTIYVGDEFEDRE